jgi:hypothetical protein
MAGIYIPQGFAPRMPLSKRKARLIGLIEHDTFMKQWLRKSPKVFLTVMGAMYGIYLLKTLLGINVSNRYSASWILKLPIQPVLTHKAELCVEFKPVCLFRSQIVHKVQNQIAQAKRTVS